MPGNRLENISSASKHPFQLLKMYKLVVTELAHQDLDSIVSYMPFNWRSTAASIFLDRLISVTAI